MELSLCSLCVDYFIRNIADLHAIRSGLSPDAIFVLIKLKRSSLQAAARECNLVCE